jgi:hypothetical protein
MATGDLYELASNLLNSDRNFFIPLKSSPIPDLDPHISCIFDFQSIRQRV